MWRNILLVGAGSFVGGVLRYIVSLLIKYSGGITWSSPDTLADERKAEVVRLAYMFSDKNVNNGE